MHPAAAYLAPDRLRTLIEDPDHRHTHGVDLPTNAVGAILSADLSGFTSLTERLVMILGLRRGADVLAQGLNRVYDRMIAAVTAYGGSVVSFSGDAIRCWFPADDFRRNTLDARRKSQSFEKLCRLGALSKERAGHCGKV